MTDLIKKEMLPYRWCDGCSIRIFIKYISEYLANGGYSKYNTSIISGIGCSGRIAGYFDLDTMHTTHGRAVPVAEGLKLSNPDLNVLVMSGDGDLLSIGLTHVINAASRNSNIKVICMNNSVYAMTGGQIGPTYVGTKSKAIDTYGIICKVFNKPYAKITLNDKKNFNEVFETILNIEGFSFIEVLFPCYEKNYKKYGFNSQAQAIKEFNKRYQYVGVTSMLEEYETGVVL